MYLAFTELGGRDPNKNCPILKYHRIQVPKHLWKPEGKSFCKSILFYGIRWHPHVSQVSPHNLKLGKPYSESCERLCLECLPQFEANDWKVQTTINFWPIRLFSQCVTVQSMLDWNESSQFRLMVESQRVSEELLCFASLYFLLFPRLLRKLCQVSFSSLSRLVNHFLSCRLSSRINKFLSRNILTRSNTWQWK